MRGVHVAHSLLLVDVQRCDAGLSPLRFALLTSKTVKHLHESLIEEFYSATSVLGKFSPISADELPAQYYSLLAHQDHMTVTLEAWHNSLTLVNVLEEKESEDVYARRITLLRQRDNEPIQFGIMRIHLAGLPEIVKMEIKSGALPLGRIMIRHHLMREVELCQLWRVTPGDELRLVLPLDGEVPLFARTARILVEKDPAVELLEIVSA